MYVVEYSDRDREDMDEEQLQYAMDFYHISVKNQKKTRQFVNCTIDGLLDSSSN